MCTNIDHHYQTVGRILVYLVEKGLARVEFDESDAMEIMTDRRGDEEEVLQTFADCLQWMLAEGLIRVGNVQEYEGGYHLSGVQLTSAGIAVIKLDPEDPDIGSSIEERVKNREAEPIDTATDWRVCW